MFEREKIYEFSEEVSNTLNELVNKSYITVEYSTGDGPPKKQLGIFKGLYGRRVLKLEIEEIIKDFENPVKTSLFVPLVGNDNFEILSLEDGVCKKIFSSKNCEDISVYIKQGKEKVPYENTWECKLKKTASNIKTFLRYDFYKSLYEKTLQVGGFRKGKNM